MPRAGGLKRDNIHSGKNIHYGTENTEFTSCQDFPVKKGTVNITNIFIQFFGKGGYVNP